MDNLSLTQLRARLSTALWGLVGIGFAAAFFSGGGSSDFHLNRSRHLLTVLVIGLGFAGHFLIVSITGRRAKGNRAIDERDLQVLARAGQATLTAYLLVQYLVSIGLWSVYESKGSVPVGWLYLLAAAAPIIGSFAFSVATILFDRSPRGSS